MGLLAEVGEGLALVFDMDGVLVDSNPVHTQAWRIYLDRFRIDPSQIETRMHGRRNDEIVRGLFGEGLSEEQIAFHGAEKERLFRELMEPQLKQRLVRGAVEFLEANRGHPMAMASNAERRNVEFVLEKSGLRPYFRVVVHGEQVERPKPHPEIYLRVAALLGVSPQNCIIFEDSPSGLKAARDSGARVVELATWGERSGNADLTIRDFFDPALKPWLAAQRPRPDGEAA